MPPTPPSSLLSGAALIALAWIVGVATEQLADSGPKVGGVLNATFGNAAELIITIFAIRAGQAGGVTWYAPETEDNLVQSSKKHHGSAVGADSGWTRCRRDYLR